ncbi:MAG: glutaredoxin family protein [Dermatophilaceae bacterium]
MGETVGEARITLIGRPGCHLCDDAEATVAVVAAQTGASWVKVSLDDAPDLHERYWERIPVVLVDGREVAYWRVSGRALRAALAR